MEAGEEVVAHNNCHSTDLLRCIAREDDDEMDAEGADDDHHPLWHDTDRTDRWGDSVDYPCSNTHPEDGAMEEEDGRGEASLTMPSSPPPFHDCASSDRSLPFPSTMLVPWLQSPILRHRDLSKTRTQAPLNHPHHQDQ